MELLKRMKKRELVEMGLKTVAAVLLSLILIILMEGMIYSIYMNKIKDNTAQSFIRNETVAYCEKVDDDLYTVYCCTDEKNNYWHTASKKMSKSEIEAIEYKDVIWHTPTPFDVSITPVHYVVMAIFVLAVLGLYGWRFYRLNVEYKGFEKKLKKSGKLF